MIEFERKLDGKIIPTKHRNKVAPLLDMEYKCGNNIKACHPQTAMLHNFGSIDEVQRKIQNFSHFNLRNGTNGNCVVSSHFPSLAHFSQVMILIYNDNDNIDNSFLIYDVCK